MKYHSKNGKTTPSHSEQPILITKDLFTPEATKTLIVSWLLMHFFVSCWYTQLLTLELKLLYLLLRNRYIRADFLSLLYTTEGLLSSIPTSRTGPRNCELPCDPEQHNRLGLMAKFKPRIKTLPSAG